MSPQIHLTAETVARLQKHAVPLMDDFNSVISRVLDSYENHAGDAAHAENGAPAPYSAGAATNLTHTKVLSAEIGGQAVAADWNSIMREAIRLAGVKLKTLEAIKPLIIVRYVVGEKEGGGYYPVAEAGISVQGQNANNAWKAASHVLKAIGVPAEITFMWYDKEEAARPGQTAKLSLKAG